MSEFLQVVASSPVAQIGVFIALLSIAAMIRSIVLMVVGAVRNVRAKKMRSEWVILWKEGKR